MTLTSIFFCALLFHLLSDVSSVLFPSTLQNTTKIKDNKMFLK